MIRVVLVDDEVMIRSGIRSILESDPRIEVVAEAGDGHEAVELVLRHQPDVVVLDIRMPVLDGLAAAKEIAMVSPSTKVVMLTTFGEDEYVERALGGGALGFLLKAADPRELISGVCAVAGGAAYLSPEITRRVIAPYRDRDRSRADRAREAVAGLSDRERDVLALLGAGATNAEIGTGLHLVEGTVKGHVSALMLKLEVRNRVEAAVVAHYAGVVDASG